MERKERKELEREFEKTAAEKKGEHQLFLITVFGLGLLPFLILKAKEPSQFNKDFAHWG